LVSGDLSSLRLLEGILQRALQCGPVRVIRRLAYRNRRIAGDGWVMIGDAAAFLDPIYSSGLYLPLASAELAAGCIHEALEANDCSAARPGAFAGSLTQGVDVVRRLIHAFYDEHFSFREFVERYPGEKPALIDCLVSDVVNKDMSVFLAALASMTPPPPRWAPAAEPLVERWDGLDHGGGEIVDRS
jgi:flavin-dependent dehydrogenase